MGRSRTASARSGEMTSLVRAAVVVLGALVLAASPALFGASAQAAETGRLAGANRYQTAAAVAGAAYPDGAGTVVLARGDDFADALAAAALAGTRGAPVLLTRPGELPVATFRALDDLGASDVVIVGGRGAVGAGVADRLRESSYAVTRIAGRDRYATAARIGRRSRVGTVNGERVAFVTRGDLPADAVTAAPVAARGPHPVLLAGRTALPRVTARALEDLDIDRAVIVGGTAAVSPRVAQQIRSLGLSTRRVGGTDRKHTAQRLAYWANRTGALKPSAVMLTRPDAFADAVASSAYGGVTGAPLLFIHSPGALSYEAERFLVDTSHLVERVVALGGTAAVEDSVVAVASSAADPPQRTVSYSVDRLGNVRADFGHFARHLDWTLTDIRGWSLHHDVRYDQVSSGAELRIHLAAPARVDAAAPGCSAQYSCRVGDDVYINDDRWMQATDTYSSRSLDDYRHYVVTHEVGHWLELDHDGCPGRGRPAPVMQQQSIRLSGCVTNVWPLQPELDAARQQLFGPSTAEQDPEAVVE